MYDPFMSDGLSSHGDNEPTTSSSAKVAETGGSSPRRAALATQAVLTPKRES